MATWDEVGRALGLCGAEKLSETAWALEFPTEREGTGSRIFVLHETMEPDLEFAMIKTTIAGINDVDARRAVKDFGQLLTGSIGYSPLFDSAGNAVDGFLCLVNSVPLGILDLTDPMKFLVYLNVFSNTAAGLRGRLGSPTA
jgi:hypothetical protein